MPTLVLRLSAPLQAWPSASRRKSRDTETTPTYSALTGLVRAAQGLPRLSSGQSPSEVLRAAVRVDRPGVVVRDFHTVNPVNYQAFERPLSANDQRKIRSLEHSSGAPTDNAVITTRFYMADACYVAMLDDPNLTLTHAFTRPGFALSAGRKSCPFTSPLVLGTSDLGFEDLSRTLPTVGRAPRDLEVHLFHPPAVLQTHQSRVLLETPVGEVGQEYRLRRRYVAHVTPPSVPTTWAQVDFLRGEPRAPVPH